MPDSCRSALSSLYNKGSLSQPGSNAGLLLARYLRYAKQEGNDDGEAAREALFESAITAVEKTTELYKIAFARRKKSLEGTHRIFRLGKNRLIIGLGANNVLETGLTLNHTYGTPLIPGSALKGLASHYCSSVWGALDPNFKGPTRDDKGNIVTSAGKHYDFMFGSTEEAGFLTFHDAWVMPDSLSNSLTRDVMTPHHGDYYMKNGASAPSDFDDPNPVTFLSIRGDFEIHVSCEPQGEESKKEESKKWEDLAMELLRQALSNWGIGGKTSSGYGRGSLEMPAAVAAPAAPKALFSPGQKVEAVCTGFNKKQKPQFEVEFNGKKIKAAWKGPDLKINKGEKITASVEFYDLSATPQMILKPEA